jgi:hypothetical protein
MKTIRELLQDLPEDVREAAIKNAEQFQTIDDTDPRYQSPTDALAASFDWTATSEGHDHWNKVFEDNGGVWK